MIVDPRRPYIKPDELRSAFDAFELLSLKGEVERFDFFRTDLIDNEPSAVEPQYNVLFARVWLKNGESYHCPVFGEAVT